MFGGDDLGDPAKLKVGYDSIKVYDKTLEVVQNKVKMNSPRYTSAVCHSHLSNEQCFLYGCYYGDLCRQ